MSGMDDSEWGPEEELREEQRLSETIAAANASSANALYLERKARKRLDAELASTSHQAHVATVENANLIAENHRLIDERAALIKAIDGHADALLEESSKGASTRAELHNANLAVEEARGICIEMQADVDRLRAELRAEQIRSQSIGRVIRTATAHIDGAGKVTMMPLPIVITDDDVAELARLAKRPHHSRFDIHCPSADGRLETCSCTANEHNVRVNALLERISARRGASPMAATLPQPGPYSEHGEH